MSLIIGIGTRIGRRINMALNKWHTVVSQMRAMFLYRVAGGADNDDLPESNGRAVINTIYGNTVKWNQLLAEGRLVDMGLPSGTLWATSNIDITQEDGFAASPFQYGCTMFSWGNVEGHNTPALGGSFSYDWGGNNSSAPWYEGQPYGATPGSTLTSAIVANDTQDAARRNAGALFKIPSKADFQELIDICIFIDANGNEIPSETTDKRVTVNNICGIYLQSTINGNKLFFACSGKGMGTTWNGVTAQGNYWTSTYYNARYGTLLSIHSGAVNTNGTSGRFSGMAIRPIVVPSTTSEVGHNNHKFCLTSNHKNMVDLTVLGYPDIKTATPTVEEVEAWLALNVGEQDYYPHDEGSLISFKGQGVRTVKNNVELDRKPFDVTKVYGMTGGSSTLVQVYPDGMFGALDEVFGGDVLGYVYGSFLALVAVRKIDLGNCIWSLVSGCNYTFETSIEIDAAEAIGYTYSETIDETDTTQDKLIGPSSGFNLSILDRSLSGSDLVDGHIAALKGVYALITPYTGAVGYDNLVYRDNGVDTPLEQLFPFKYKVDKYSTEEVLVPTGDAPTSTSMIADIEYQGR